MSLRVIVALIILIAGLIWTIRRPFIGVCLIIALFHLNLRMFGAGLDEIRFQYITTIVLLISYFINQYKLQDIQTPLRAPLFWLFGFLMVGFLTSSWAVESIPLAFESTIDFAKIVLFAFLMVKIVQTKKEMDILIWFTLACVLYTSFMTRWGVEWDWIDEVEAGIATGATGTHILMFFPLLITLGLTGKNWWEKIAAFAIIPFMLDSMTVLEGGFRSTFLTLVVSTVCFIIFAPNKLKVRSLAPFAVGGILFVYVLAPPGYFEYMKTIFDPASESSAASRDEINKVSFEILREYPFGIGYNNYPLISMDYLSEEYLTDEGTRDAHNGYLKVATEFGLLGFFVWMGMFVTAYLYFRRVRKAYPKSRPPTRLQMYAFSLSVGLLGTVPGIYTHSYNDLDTLYWFVAFSCILYNLQYPVSTEEQSDEIKTEKTKFDPPFTPKNVRPPAEKIPQPAAVPYHRL
jgi:O-antigen ligase